MQLESGIVVALLVGAVLIYDRLGGNDELARRMFQVGLAISLVFLVLSATHAFIRQDPEGASLILASSGSSAEATDAGDRIAAAITIHYAVGVLLLITGLAMLNRYHTLPLGAVLGGVLLILFGGGQGGLSGIDALLRTSVNSSQEVDVVTFVAAVGGTAGLLWYGTRLEKEFSVESELEDETEDIGADSA